MKLLQNYAVLLGLILTLGFSINSSAATDYNNRVYQKGTISEVNMDNNTFTVVHSNTGKAETYNLPESVKVIIDGNVQSGISALAPGQSVTLKFRQTGDASNSETYTSMTIKGTVMEIDKELMKGVLKETGTDKLVKFRLADNFKRSHIPDKGEKVEFTYHLESLTLTSAK